MTLRSHFLWIRQTILTQIKLFTHVSWRGNILSQLSNRICPGPRRLVYRLHGIYRELAMHPGSYNRYLLGGNWAVYIGLYRPWYMRMFAQIMFSWFYLSGVFDWNDGVNATSDTERTKHCIVLLWAMPCWKVSLYQNLHVQPTFFKETIIVVMLKPLLVFDFFVW